MPPSVSRSVASSVTPSTSRAASTVLTSACSASARACGPCCARTASVPENRTKAMVADAVLGVRRARRRGTRRGAIGNRVAHAARRRRAGRMPACPGPSAGRAAPQQQRAVVAGPGRAAGEAGRGRRADDDLAGLGRLLGARRRRSRRGRARAARGWGTPTRKSSTSPEWTPTDIDSEKPARPTWAPRRPRAATARISTAASQACSGWSSPRKRKSSASPPNFSSSPPRAAAIVSIGPNTRLSVSTISSAPIRPCRDSRSVRAVKPETSAKTSVPSTTRCSAPGRLVVPRPA